MQTLGQIYTDLGYLVDVGVITDSDYDQIIAKIPRRYRGPITNQSNTGSSSHENSATPSISLQNRADSPANVGRPVPAAPTPVPQASTNSPALPSIVGIGQAEGLYDYQGTDSSDLPFSVGDHITILEYVNSGRLCSHHKTKFSPELDWWKGECNGRQGLFPSNYVRKTSDTGRRLEQVSWQQAQQYPVLPANQYDPQQYQPVQYAPPPQNNQQVAYAQTGALQTQPAPVTVVQDKKTGKLHSIGGKLGNAAIFGAGATSKSPRETTEEY